MLAVCAGYTYTVQRRKSNFNNFSLVMDHLVIQEEKTHYNVLYKELEGNGRKYFPSSFS